MRLRHASLHTKVAATGDKSHASIGSAGLVLEASEFMAAPVDSWQQWQAFGLLMRGSRRFSKQQAKATTSGLQ